MRVGIRVPYQRSENTWLALQLASWLKTQGIVTSVLAIGACNDNVHPDWDNFVKSDMNYPFKEWVKKQSYVIWFGVASPSDIFQAKRSGQKIVMVASWEDNIYYNSLFRHATKVICLSPSLAHRLRGDTNMRNIFYVPLDLPSFTPHKTLIIRPERPRVLLNLRGPKSGQFGSMLANTMSNLFEHIVAEWTIWVPRSLLHDRAWVSKTLEHKNSEGAYHFASKADWDTQRMLYSWNDLTLLPTLRGGHGSAIVISLLSGTPVITFDVPPANEYLSKENGILAPCQVEYNKEGLARMIPDLQRYETCITKALQQKNTLSKLKKHTSDWSEERRKLFKDGWLDVLS